MILLVTSAFAQDLPWKCPPITIAADATVYRDDTSAHDAIALVWDELTPWLSYPCAWEETSSDDEYHPGSERICDDGIVRVEVSSSSTSIPGDRSTSSEATYSVTGNTGETWTSLTIETSSGASWSETSSSHYSATTVSWTGSVAGLPDDGSISFESSSSEDWDVERASFSVSTPSCSWSWADSPGMWSTVEAVATTDHTVSVERDISYCGYQSPSATIDGVLVGAVDPTTWERDPNDADGDGCLAGIADCDDADPTRSACQIDVPNDGVDQDCSGSDNVDFDVDGDGYDALAFDGTDCDDADADVYPGADDAPRDAIDQDCDGADDVDADHDGYTADGDDAPADCDDTSSHVLPGVYDPPYDGVDQDCDGVDPVDMDEDGYDASEAGGPDCDDDDDTIGPHGVEVACDGIDQDCRDGDTCDRPEVEESGCTGSAAFVLLTPLLGIRRKRPLLALP